MMTDSLLGEGVRLMLAGMLTVVFFLTILVIATAVLSRVSQRWWPHPQQPNKQARLGVSPAEVAAVTAAIHRHREQIGGGSRRDL